MHQIPHVANVGRPNVGKSTLFNRLTGKRTALVSDMPGLTRDRREGEAVLAEHKIMLVDTAGLEDAVSGSIAHRMRQQSQAAIADADLVLFVIDAREGVTPADEAFARLVRASGHPVILVANKAEGRAGEAGFLDAFALGLGEPVAISAEHGEGIGDLVADMMAALGLKVRAPSRGGRSKRNADSAQENAAAVEDNIAEAGTRAIRVAIVGRPNAGKSTLVNALLGKERMITGPEPGLTRDTIATELVWKGQRFKLFDTAGLRRKARVTELAEKLSTSDAVRAIRFAEVVVLLVDAERPLEHQDLTIGEMVESEGRALVIAVNKWDLVAEKQKRLKELAEMAATRLSQVADVALVPVSALGETGLDRLMAAVVTVYERWNTRIPTPDLNRWLMEAVDRHTPPAANGRRIRLRYITQPSARPPTFVAFCSRPEDLPRSYVRYLINSLRTAFGLPGVPIRFNLKRGENPYAARQDKRRPRDRGRG
ncbi:MAG: ribosome biogenesis GTPase Der [Hyphomicrobiaceae bacterium]